ncbi:MAG: hypothetical protein A4S17_02360 [Proteobacteria bacterium HN_bin10]|nr:MAG: hypothetical protein A4S17_02360 [Proteobacteria bacterium HN_bin10]
MDLSAALRWRLINRNAETFYQQGADTFLIGDKKVRDLAEPALGGAKLKKGGAIAGAKETAAQTGLDTFARVEQGSDDFGILPVIGRLIARAQSRNGGAGFLQRPRRCGAN